MKNLAFILALVLFSSVAIGQKVNYSGEWKLNESKSELGYDFSMAPKSVSVQHAKKTLDLKTVNVWEGQEMVNESHFTLDGKECTNTGFGGTETTSTAVYDKKTKTLTIETNGYADGIGDWTSIQVMSMKEDDLVIDFTAASDMGEITEVYVFNKQ
jgi:hypothetical protein